MYLNIICNTLYYALRFVTIFWYNSVMQVNTAVFLGKENEVKIEKWILLF